MAEKIAIADKWINRGYRATLVLRIVGVSRSSYYHRISHKDFAHHVGGGRPIPGYSYDSHGRRICNEQVKKWINELVEGEGFAYGYLKLTICLHKKYGLAINKKKVYRLCKELGVLKPQRRLVPKYPRKLARNRQIDGPNQLWETDIKYGYIAGEDRFFFIQSVLDIYDRSVVDYHIELLVRPRTSWRPSKGLYYVVNSMGGSPGQ